MTENVTYIASNVFPGGTEIEALVGFATLQILLWSFVYGKGKAMIDSRSFIYIDLND